LRAAGFAYRDLEGRGVLLPVIEYGARFAKSADYDDRLAIEATIRDLRSRAVTFNYRVKRGEELVAEGFTRHVCADGELKPRRFPDEVVAAVQSYVEGS
jgi:acyl-CoA thioester hydrolase